MNQYKLLAYSNNFFNTLSTKSTHCVPIITRELFQVMEQSDLCIVFASKGENTGLCGKVMAQLINLSRGPEIDTDHCFV